MQCFAGQPHPSDHYLPRKRKTDLVTKSHLCKRYTLFNINIHQNLNERSYISMMWQRLLIICQVILPFFYYIRALAFYPSTWSPTLKIHFLTSLIFNCDRIAKFWPKEGAQKQSVLFLSHTLKGKRDTLSFTFI